MMTTLDNNVLPRNLTAEKILAIAATAPEKLFSGDLALAKSEYHELCRFWHPDRNRTASAARIFQHINLLYDNAVELLRKNMWRGAGFFEITSEKTTRRIFYRRNVEFELGEMYVGETEVIFSLKRDFQDLFENARRQIARLPFADARMRAETARYLPHKPEFLATAERLLMLVAKPPDVILLADLLDYCGGALDARHVCWISGGLHNLACYFNYAGIAHQDIGAHSYFVSPRNHYGMLLGGWFYARRTNETLQALPARTIKNAPADVLRNKIAAGRTDLELIRATGRELLGDASGANLPAIPAALNRWFNGATSGDAVTDYELWKNAVQMSYGKPRFVSWDVDANAVYGG